MNIDVIGTSNSINLLIGFIIVACFVLMHFIEMVSFGSRVAGRVTDRVALGTTLQVSINTLSRFFLVPFLPLIAFLVETGITIEDYLVLVIFSYLLSFIASILILFKLNLFQSFFQTIFVNYSHNSILKAFSATILQKNKNIKLITFVGFSLRKVIIKKVIVSCVAYLFLITGFFIAFMLAILYPENRLTLTQFTATFHGFGAIIVAIYLDPMLSRSIDLSNDEYTWVANVYSIILGRVLSYFLVLTSMLTFLAYKIF
jgi:hypothetical protein